MEREEEGNKYNMSEGQRASEREVGQREIGVVIEETWEKLQ